MREAWLQSCWRYCFLLLQGKGKKKGMRRAAKSKLFPRSCQKQSTDQLYLASFQKEQTAKGHCQFPHHRLNIISVNPKPLCSTSKFSQDTKKKVGTDPLWNVWHNSSFSGTWRTNRQLGDSQDTVERSRKKTQQPATASKCISSSKWRDIDQKKLRMLQTSFSHLPVTTTYSLSRCPLSEGNELLHWQSIIPDFFLGD